jgi:hypothetical protein
VYRSWTRDFPEFSRILASLMARTTDGNGHRITKLIALVLFLLTSPVFAQDSTPGTVRGTVVDARTGTPLGRVLVAVEDGPSAETSAHGGFLLENVASGTIRIHVSAIGYGPAQRTLVLRPKEDLILQIPLSEGAASIPKPST